MKTLADCYPNIKRYVDHITQLYPDGTTSWGLGDWVPVKSKTEVELTSTCYYYKDVMILAKAAEILGFTEDEQRYDALAGKIKEAFNAKFFDSGKAQYRSGLQTEMSVPLHFGLVPDGMAGKVAANLARSVAVNGYKLDVGLLGTKSILNALSENGYADVAYKIAAQETYPSWGWWVKNEATTLYENWDIQAKNDISLNHIMFGEIGAWFYKGVGGIHPDPEKPGFERVLIRPHFSVPQFNCSHNGPYGKIVSSWTSSKGVISYTLVVPPNSTAIPTFDDAYTSVLLNGKKWTASQAELPAGTWRFELR